ncbi:hypothetical protein BDV96DRAFT_596855 [Lophiotrema nucula]|uniref:EamA domain-containing protein n=1 Tax=Lophiotrema nucula TaxID=690887 RepID=A0A6A5ZIV9_9PLEO|nr:hypothetical protein BDV96DRAFT_596855 [Lophiotrema nucula]
MPSLPAATVYAFGFTSFLFGITTLLNPSHGLEALSLHPGARPAVISSSLAAVAMGIYYALAAYQENRAFFWLTVPMRSLTATVFLGMGGGWMAPGVWEGAGAMLTLGALLWEGREKARRAGMKERGG